MSHKDKRNSFPEAPAKCLKTRHHVEVMDLTQFGFIYNRRGKQYFLFVDEYNGFDIHDEYDINYNFMNIYAINGNTPL